MCECISIDLDLWVILHIWVILSLSLVSVVLTCPFVSILMFFGSSLCGCISYFSNFKNRFASQRSACLFLLCSLTWYFYFWESQALFLVCFHELLVAVVQPKVIVLKQFCIHTVYIIFMRLLVKHFFLPFVECVLVSSLKIKSPQEDTHLLGLLSKSIISVCVFSVRNRVSFSQCL